MSQRPAVASVLPRIAPRPTRPHGPSPRIDRDPERCVHCGGCVVQCQTGALQVDPKSFEVVFDTTRCRGCRRCIAVCSYRAITLGRTEPKESQP